jgi:hypothetical protein
MITPEFEGAEPMKKSQRETGLFSYFYFSSPSGTVALR